MLQLKNIKKKYISGDFEQVALDGVSLNFRNSEFVAILGPSGSGKTTMLNIIGGLDKYSEGDLIINGISTKKYTDRDWDSYRNHTIGFVFQNYNLIPHQSILANVELALTISGVSRQERKQRAKKALEEVGLGDQLHKKPSQLSGGQMQRVAIARALVNNPDILLADEPTGALDTETSIQVMELIKKISENRLVIMVTHNPELAETYANRTISVRDGKVVSDTNPYEISEKECREPKHKNMGKSSMSFKTALLLSFNNLKTKKARTLLTSFAGSIGIIGIALILALSNGIQVYIDSIQRDTLTSYPISIESSVVDMTSAMSIFSSSSSSETVEEGVITSNNSMAAMIEGFTQGVWNNDLASFTKFIKDNSDRFAEHTTGIRYVYDNIMNIYSVGEDNTLNQVSPSPVLTMIDGMSVGGVSLDSSILSSYKSVIDTWQELMDNEEVLKKQYTLVDGRWPTEYNEVVLIVDRNNQINDFVQQGLGLTNNSEMMEALMAIQGGGEFKSESKSFAFEDVYDLKFKLVLETDYYKHNAENNTWQDMRGDEGFLNNLVLNSQDIKIVGIIRPAGDTVSSGGIGYTSDLTKYIINKTNSSKIVKQQKASPETDVFTGLPFKNAETETTKTTPTNSINKTMVVSPMSYAAAPISVEAVENSQQANSNMPDFSSAPEITEEELYQKIDKALSEQEAEEAKRIIGIMLKNVYSISDRQELADYFDKLLEGQTIEGVGEISGTQVVSMLAMMDKTTKLKMLGSMFDMYLSSEKPTATEPDSTTEKPTQPTTETPNATEPNGDEPATMPNENTNPDEGGSVESVTEKPLATDYENALSLLGVVDLDKPQKINIYPKDFESKEIVSEIISEYNEANAALGDDEKEIKYTDYIGMLLSSVTTIINVVSYILIAFVAVSLIVSSIMIGIITYISVLERTKEIGILRAIGASKMNISQVFNAETFIVGLCSGLIGIVTTILFIIPGNAIIHHITGNENMNAVLPPVAALILIVLSMLLTVIAGLIPARKAAKKDPVIALRSE